MSGSYEASSGLLLLCPGQGAQHCTMFDMAGASPAAAALLERLMELSPVLAAVARPPAGTAAESALFSNRNAQPLIVAATLLMWEALRADLPPPALVAGYSIGELSAYGVAGAWPAEQAVALAASRASLMDACLAQHPGQAMVAVSGVALAPAQALAERHGYAIAIETAEDSSIVGGPARHLPGLLAELAAAGGRTTVLPVEVASHTPAMHDAVAPFARQLEHTAFAAMRTPVLAGVSAEAVHSRQQAVTQLARQLAQTIRWSACMDAAAEAGVRYALELGPGNALSRMLQARHPHINSRSVADFRTLDGIRTWLARAADEAGGTGTPY